MAPTLRRSTRTAAAASTPTSVATKPPKKNSKAAPPKKGGKKTKKGLAGKRAPDSSQPLGRVDPASKLKGKIFIDDDGSVYDVMLNLVDVSKNSDKYFILQAVEQPNGSCAMYTRWGRTGTAGSSSIEEFNDAEDVVVAFAKKFESKTDVPWEDKDTYTHQAGKYLWVQIDHLQNANMWAEAAKWQYWVDDGVDEKEDGWYDYTEEASDVVEQLHHEWTFSAHLCQRVVESGVWEYLVDLTTMTQTNNKHAARKQRHIRRWTPALGDDQTPPGDLKAAKQEDEEEEASTATPPPAPTVVAPVTPDPKTPTKRNRGGATASTQATPTSKPAPEVEPATAVKAVFHSVDPLCTLSGGKVYGDYNVMLNQTNVSAGANNNKYYRIQLLTDASAKKFFVWTRWGRVGEDGQNNLAGAMKEDAAIAMFCNKFKSKTGNAWDDRDDFAHKSGKYDLVEIDEDEDDQAALAATPKKPKVESDAKAKFLPSALDPATQRLINLIFNEDMFNAAMQDFDIDVKKMPLGNLSKAQVQKGYDALTELKAAIAASDSEEVQRLTSRFYTVIPHNFGRQRPPLIDTAEKLQTKFEMCDVLADIETAQEMLQDMPDVKADSKKLVPNPLDEKYATLQAKLDVIPERDSTYKMVETYFKNTTCNYLRNVKLENVWAVDGKKDGEEFLKKSAKIGNRKLLWHGTNVAVVAAIVKGGLRIMPHSGGRVGKGIYLASEHGKSAGYVRPSANTGIMFLVEAALGKVKTIQRDDSSLKAAPPGFDSILAKGRQEPDPKKDTKFKLDKHDVSVPQGAPLDQSDAAGSSFSQSEYLVYKESQQRLRYVLTFKW